MRIVAGRWRGRIIEAPAGAAVRPTLDRVREAWMSILQKDIPGAKALDLFAGSGALGLEALSRGAVSVDFVEKSASSLRALKANVEKLGAVAESRIHRADALKFVEGLSAGDFDIAFADPPYAGGGAERLCTHWLQVPFSSIFTVEHAASDPMPAGGDTRRYGTSAITIYRSGE
ncbi:MAG TPA: 16S rRNA (guanine(966)-N(2))-methyltransferase RsmD [Gemmatimonadaceae bacterium]|nr:16S rRNA (guanine(966)-N(2))-methyltransferase RsmD [Gemmatimonadaceae bacterium]